MNPAPAVQDTIHCIASPVASQHGESAVVRIRIYDSNGIDLPGLPPHDRIALITHIARAGGPRLSEANMAAFIEREYGEIATVEEVPAAEDLPLCYFLTTGSPYFDRFQLSLGDIEKALGAPPAPHEPKDEPAWTQFVNQPPPRPLGADVLEIATKTVDDERRRLWIAGLKPSSTPVITGRFDPSGKPVALRIDHMGARLVPHYRIGSLIQHEGVWPISFAYSVVLDVTGLEPNQFGYHPEANPTYTLFYYRYLVNIPLTTPWTVNLSDIKAIHQEVTGIPW
jgi:hypothetical protein